MRQTAARVGLGVALAVAALFSATRSVGTAGEATRLAVAGRPEVVFDWSRQACSPTEEADLPVRAFRDVAGRVQLLLSHFENFRMVGPSLERLRPDCRPVMLSSNRAAPRRFADRQWLASLYSTDGRHIAALVHDEYQGNLHPGRCPQRRYEPCWYNAITLARSNDAGRSYRAVPTPAGLLAASPHRYRAGAGPTGVFGPSNVVSQHGFLYFLARVREPGVRRGDCLLRARRMFPARGWSAWDGNGFGAAFADPYRNGQADPGRCALVAPGAIAEMTESLTFSPASSEYLLVGMAPAAESRHGVAQTGVYYSLSDDLVHWSTRRLLFAAPTVHSYRCGGPAPIAYPSLVDPRSKSRTFTTVGGRPFLYYTRFAYRDCRRTPDRDLMRVRVAIGNG